MRIFKTRYGRWTSWKSGHERVLRMPYPTEIRAIAGAHARARWDAITVGAPNARSSHGPAGAWCDAGRDVAGVAEPGPQFGVMPRQTSGGVVARRSIQQGGNLHVDDAVFLKDPLAFGEQPGNQHAGTLSQAFELDAALARRDDVATNTPVLRAWCVPFPVVSFDQHRFSGAILV